MDRRGALAASRSPSRPAPELTQRLGSVEIIVILVIALIVIPPDNLPDVMRGVGKILRELRLASNLVVRELSGVIDEPAAARPARAVNPMADALRPAAEAVPPAAATMRPAAAAESAKADTSADPTAPR